MAFTLSRAPHLSGLRRALAPSVAHFGAAVSAYLERQARTGEFARLEAKSVAELGAMGVSRARLAYHVYRDRFYC